MMDLNSHIFLTKEEMKIKANSIFASKGAESTSEKYSHIPTFKVIEDMALLGFGVVEAKEIKARKNAGFQKHLVIFRNNNIVIKGADGDDAFPSILLTNSSDGKNAFTFQCSIFRMICENGLIISTQDFAKLRIRHMGYDFKQLQNVINEIVGKLPLTIESMNKMKGVELVESQIMDFAKKALTVRFGEVEMNRITIDYTEFTKATRVEDEGNSLWNVFNRIQEKVIDGDFNYGFSTKTRKARKIKNFQQDIKVNIGLWELATQYCSN